MNVPFFDYKNIFVPYKDELLKITDAIISKGQYIFGEDLESFEKLCAQRVGSKYALGVGNATDAMEILLQAHEIPEGAEVLIASHTMSATASAIVSVGGIPVPTDIDKFGMMDPMKLEQYITGKTWAIMPTQLNGSIAEMPKIIKIAHKYSLKLFEDSAQALGASLNGKKAGNFADGGVYSFYPAKVLGCLGDGGMIVVNSNSVFERAKAIRDHGRSDTGATILYGRNSRLDNLQAAYLKYFMLNHFDNWLKKRERITKIYDNELSSIPQIVTPKYNYRSGLNVVYQNYEMLVENRNQLQNYLKQLGIGTLQQWGGIGIHKLDTFSGEVKLHNAERYFERCLMLPLNQTMSEDQAFFVTKKIHKFFEAS